MTPTTIGRYEIQEELGRGGMATIYRAYDPRTQRQVALKVLPQAFLDKSDLLKRFQCEAETIASAQQQRSLSSRWPEPSRCRQRRIGAYLAGFATAVTDSPSAIYGLSWNEGYANNRRQNMSIQIPCPHCGPRPIEEFAFGEILVVPEQITDPDERDLDRAFMHNNPEGPQEEAWFHTYGCRRWVRLTRDTRTDKIQ